MQCLPFSNKETTMFASTCFLNEVMIQNCPLVISFEVEITDGFEPYQCGDRLLDIRF